MERIEEITSKNKKLESNLLKLFKNYAESQTEPKFPIRVYESRSKEIDAVWKRGDLTFIIEAKIIEAKSTQFYEAIGQVFVYEYLYQKVYPNEKTKKGIVCEEHIIDQEFLSFCSEKDITIFVRTKNGFYEHEPKNY